MAERRSYTKEQREAAVADVPALGVNAAAKRHGVSQTNMSRWAAAAGVQREGEPSSAPKAKARARTSKEGARPKRKLKAPSAEETKREEPVVTGPSEPKAPSADASKRAEPVAATTQPPVRRTLKMRVAKIYTPSQKAEIVEHSATHGPTETGKKFGVSRYSIYAWQRKVSNAAEGNGPSPTAGPAPGELRAVGAPVNAETPSGARTHQPSGSARRTLAPQREDPRMELRRTKAENHHAGLIDALASVSEAKLRDAILGVSKPRHMLHHRAENRRAAQYIAGELEEYGYAVEIEGELRNVVATPRGTADRPLVLVGAHYDSVPGTPGADDNASGIAGMLAAAQALARLDPAPPVGFVAWNGEEDGLLGSVEFVARRRAPGGAPIAAVHVLEMIGYASHTPGSQRMPIAVPGAPDVGDFIGLIGNQRSNHLVELAVKQAEAVVPELPVVGLKVHLGLEGWLPVLHRSDHSPFWKAQIPAMLWTDTAEFRNPNYHRATDTPKTLDYGFLRCVTEEVEAAATSIGVMLGDANVELPSAVVVDVGRMTDRGWGVVEANPAWASGLCGSNPASVLPVLRRATVPRGMLSEADQRWVRRTG